ncbi:hypothetical protein PTKIN_Ptkin01aG0073500 [Pterospermum kingtungense]
MEFPKPPSSTVSARISPPASTTPTVLPLIFPSVSSRRRLSLVALSSRWFLSRKAAAAATLSPEQVAKTLTGTAVYTVSNSNNEFVLISDPNGAKSIGLLCFRQEDAYAFLAQVRLRRRELRSNAKVVPIKLDQAYSLKVDGIAFRLLLNPIRIKNALELKSGDIKSGFDGVPVFQIDIERGLSKVSRASKGPGFSQHIMVGSLEDVLKKMEMSEKNSGWDDLYSFHLAKAILNTSKICLQLDQDGPGSRKLRCLRKPRRGHSSNLPEIKERTPKRDGGIKTQTLKMEGKLSSTSNSTFMFHFRGLQDPLGVGYMRQK